MSVLERTSDILNHYVGERYSGGIVEAILNDFRIEFGLDVDGWTTQEDLDAIEEYAYNIYIHTEEGKEFIYLVLNKDGYITHFNFVEHIIQDMVPEMTCPLCETGAMEPRAIDNDKALNGEKKTYMYVCESCPGILVEWYDDSDTEAFARGIR